VEKVAVFSRKGVENLRNNGEGPANLSIQLGNEEIEKGKKIRGG